MFSHDLIKVVEALTTDTFKEVDKSQRQRRQFDRRRAYYHVREPSKKDLMMKYFREAFEIASGGYSVTVRQVFYTLRNLINIKENKDLNQSDYNNTFTQQVVTDYIESHPELENKLLFERRGYFYNPFFDEEMPLGTMDVIQFLNRKSNNKISKELRTIYDLPENLQYSQVLFIEKQGFNIILKESGLLEELNLAIMSTQGFGTRASKRLIQKLLNDGIEVYILHDCDIAGYLIWEKFSQGSHTFRRGLDVTRLGLTLADVKRLNKLDYAETVTYQRNYSDALRKFTQEERDFFVVDGHTFKRVELNTLTSPEFIDFVKQKLTYKPIIPDLKQLERYIEINPEEIIKDALYQIYGDEMPEVEINTKLIAKKVNEKLKSNKTRQHWTGVLNEVIAEYKDKKVAEVVKKREVKK